MELTEILNNVYPISQSAVEMLTAGLRPVSFRKGDHLIVQGKVCGDVYIIKTGMLRNYALYDGEEDTRWFATDGDLVASMHSVCAGQPAIASVEALSDVEAWAIDSDRLKELVKASHEWSVWFNQLFIGGLFVMEWRYTFLGHGDAAARYDNFIRMRPKGFHDKIKLKHIASYLNITPQSLSRVRRRVTKR